MSDEIASEANAEHSGESGKKFLDVIRDENFVRLAPDSVLVADRGPDIEVNLLVHERTPIRMEPETDTPFVNLDGEFTMRFGIVEIARIRLSPPTSMNLAMNIMHQNIEAGRINLEGFKKSIDDMIANAMKNEEISPE